MSITPRAPDLVSSPLAVIVALLLLPPAALAWGTPQDREPPPGVNWASFRGPAAQGIAEGFPTPIEWSVERDEGILWRVPLEGLAHSSPIVHGDRLFVTNAVRVDAAAELSSLYGSAGYGAGDSVEDEGPHRFELVCFDKHTGKVIWKRTAFEGVPKVPRHPKSTHANPTPAADEGHVLAFFGSEGLYCYNHDGELLWSRDLGVLDAGAPGQRKYHWGYAASPVIHGKHVIVQCDIQDQSFLAALDIETGEDLWRTERDEDPTWSTPTVHESGVDGRAQIIANGYKHIGGYDLLTGEEIWKTSGGGDIPVPTPVVSGDLIYLTSAHGRMRPIRAVHVGATGEFGSDPKESEQLAWIHPRKGIYMQTPIVYEGLLFCCSDGGILGCYDAKTGEEFFNQRLGSGGSGFSGSAVAADGKLYFTAEDGRVYVIAAIPELEVLAVNDLGETCLSTPAISEGRLYFRTRSHLLAVGQR